MDETLSYLTLNRQVGLAREMTAIANNIANLSTTGYRREGMVFAEFISSAAPEASLSMADLRGRFASDLPGEVTVTGGELDLAIQGEGYFTIDQGGEILLTRAGAFQRSPEGMLVTPDGDFVLDEGGGQIFLPPDAPRVAVAPDGTVSAGGAPLARIGVVTVPQESLTRAGFTAFRSLAPVAPVPSPRLLQGALEGSNVNPVAEIARMIEVSRAYESAQGLAEDADQRVRDTLSRQLAAERKGQTMQALKIAATGMAAQQTRVDVTANNIANMSTTGYDARRAEFADLHYQQLRTPGAMTALSGQVLPVGVQIGLGVRPSAVSMEVRQGSLQRTGGELDIAIEGAGYFEIALPSGATAYTRDGGFKLSAEGEIVTSDGNPLLPGITVPADAREVVLNPDGTVYARFEGQIDLQQIGTLSLASFINEKGLEAIGDNLFLETGASGPALTGEPGVDGRGTFRQGFLESSSVDVVAEITELIEAQRGYELNSRVMAASDEMMSSATRIR